MIETVFNVLTDLEARADDTVEASLVDYTSAGAPWADEGF